MSLRTYGSMYGGDATAWVFITFSTQYNKTWNLHLVWVIICVALLFWFTPLSFYLKVAWTQPTLFGQSSLAETAMHEDLDFLLKKFCYLRTHTTMRSRASLECWYWFTSLFLFIWFHICFMSKLDSSVRRHEKINLINKHCFLSTEEKFKGISGETIMNFITLLCVQNYSHIYPFIMFPFSSWLALLFSLVEVKVVHKLKNLSNREVVRSQATVQVMMAKMRQAMA